MVKVICGDFEGTTGPTGDVAISPEYLDVSVPVGENLFASVQLRMQGDRYVFEGSADFGGSKQADNGTILVFDEEGDFAAGAGPKGVRFLLISGMPLNEPIAWYGPIVMNTEED